VLLLYAQWLKQICNYLRNGPAMRVFAGQNYRRTSGRRLVLHRHTSESEEFLNSYATANINSDATACRDAVAILA
jgi:hypothetical protein